MMADIANGLWHFPMLAQNPTPHSAPESSPGFKLVLTEKPSHHLSSVSPPYQIRKHTWITLTNTISTTHSRICILFEVVSGIDSAYFNENISLDSSLLDEGMIYSVAKLSLSISPPNGSQMWLLALSSFLGLISDLPYSNNPSASSSIHFRLFSKVQEDSFRTQILITSPSA